MALQLVANGNNLESFKRVVAGTPGEGVTVLEIDVRDKVVIPYAPDIPVGSLIRGALPAMDASIRLVPGVHLVAPSSYTVRNNIGTLRVQLRTNPLPLIPIAVAVAIISILGISGILSWRILRDSPTEVPGGSFGPPLANGTGTADTELSFLTSPMCPYTNTKVKPAESAFSSM